MTPITDADNVTKADHDLCNELWKMSVNWGNREEMEDMIAAHRIASTEALTARVAVLEGALRPFAKQADNFDYGDGSGPDLEDYPNASSLGEVHDITVGDCRRARQALGDRDES